MEYLYIFTHILLIMSLGWYLITNLQWYNYKLERVILKHHKWQWHITYFASPIVFFYILPDLYFTIYFYLLFMTSFVLWNKKLDRPLVLTGRVKRFLALLLFITFAIIALCLTSKDCNSSAVLFVPIFIAYIVSSLLEKIFFISFKHKAKERLDAIPALKIVAITASYGKTSIKNYLYHLLKRKYKVYKTPRSVNTMGGIVLDVNRDLPLDSQIYIAEAGAREKGDIEEITTFLEPHYCVLGSVGEQHIEYFKTLDNIIQTKMEILTSPRMKKGFVHESVPIKDYETIVKFPDNLHVTMSNLDGIWFDIVINGKQEHFSAPILGSFNAINLTAVILVAHELGMSIDEIKLALKDLPQVEHRLQKIEAGGKIIIDDSFNGNLEGMLEAINICSHHEGRKVIITPGLVESTSEANILLANEINEKFDFAIITGTLNAHLLSSNIDEDKLFILKEKADMEKVLAEKTRAGDLILFANDAPNFI
ncbi:UDP-N-acetylmuramoyl-tripeptide--D-alanyl-D-alanine ligase [Halarcobacter sp.]|uniref:UDP-N-acetylmuramoyl-tripeptide--D-alanyl-D- alanine ligase n=1 Tax=Halarcobacter sp. TaxID=2321133 RepID=UPI002AA947D6|nr:UDP-N-acetylmuramoyl-tripeptide--D-alanyl-D-alanine ligase [Halarcobacter sp.]